MTTQGFRVVPLTSAGNVPHEVGEYHHFSLSLERTRWWAYRLSRGLEDDQYVPDIFSYNYNGYAIATVVAEDVKEDRFFPGGEDRFGKIACIVILEIQIHPILLRRLKRRRRWWRWWRR
ncbi:MAG: hypothetical protein Q8P39_00725 [Candidatus Yanofskybacteria bacterium]|nr:hypothetical protein [Candidatus Yanofskybacteria bacterium]